MVDERSDDTPHLVGGVSLEPLRGEESGIGFQPLEAAYPVEIDADKIWGVSEDMTPPDMMPVYDALQQIILMAGPIFRGLPEGINRDTGEDVLELLAEVLSDIKQMSMRA